MNYKEIIDHDKSMRPRHYDGLLHNNKDIIGPFLDNNLNKINNDHYVSDPFKNIEKEKTNILFAGCSITAGCGVNSIKKTWSYKLYNSINTNNKCSGYFNVAFSGASPIEIVLNILKYIAKYGCPDYIFILFSNWGRDFAKFNTLRNRDTNIKNAEWIEIFNFNLYSILEDICKKNNAKLFSTSWSDLVPGITDFINLDIYDFEKYMNEFMKYNFNTYYQIDKQRFTNNVYDFIQNNDKKMTIIGNDETHPSEAVHYAWFKEAEYQLERSKNVNNGN